MTDAEPARFIRSRDDLEDYVAAFNGKNYARQISYYHPDVMYKVGSLVINSPQGIADFYSDFHTYSKEVVRIGEFAMTGDTVAVTIPSYFAPFKDYTKHDLSFLAGQIYEFVTFGFYKLKGGQIWRIRTARYAGTEADFK